jgi:hypothetical protein
MPLADRGRACAPSDTNLCIQVDLFSGERGHYTVVGQDGVSPDIVVGVGMAYTFNQYHMSNWFHPLGFAYYPDGAHGATWGGEGRAEIEGKGELQYKIDGQNPSCDDAGDTGLDCYEPEFFYPRGVWAGKTYSAVLNITEEVAAKSNGGVLYYFCHIHSKMSGRIIIKGADGRQVSGKAGSAEVALYGQDILSGADKTCGTTGIAPYAGGGAKACDQPYVCADFNSAQDSSWLTWQRCLQAIDCQMHVEMMEQTTGDSDNMVAVFVQQMLPHHINAINMAKMLLKQEDPAKLASVEGFEEILWSIVNVQNYEVHRFRNYLAGVVAATAATTATAADVNRLGDEQNDTQRVISFALVGGGILVVCATWFFCARDETNAAQDGDLAKQKQAAVIGRSELSTDVAKTTATGQNMNSRTIV